MDKKTHREGDVSALVAELADPSGAVRRRAREKLVALGGPAVDLLLELLTHRKAHLRWEAAKALGGIRDPRAAADLVRALEEDEDGDVRWLAAEALIALGWEGLRPLLARLADRPGSVALREGAHRVCHSLGGRKAYGAVRPVLDALNEPDPELAVSSVARVALDELRLVFGMIHRDVGLGG
ncbi:MAG: HEAT repeat domain-containing protein [Pirellulales bacterium]|nr:HEAT repeat domain-containing protein [Pirellulales bacterium]